LLQVDSGTLELAFGLTNRGRIVVPAGTRLDISGHRLEATGDASMEGGGEVRINLPAFGGLDWPAIRGTVDLSGRLQLLGDFSPLAFSGDRVRLNRLEVQKRVNDPVVFRPLAFSVQSVLLRQGTIWFASPALVELPELVTEGGSDYRLRAETPVTVTGPARLDALWVGGSAPVRFAGPVALARLLRISPVFLGDPPGGVVELASPLPLTDSTEVEVSATGELRVLAGIEFALPEGPRVQIGGTLVNDGVVRTSDGLAGTADAARGGTVLNRGLLEARSGLLRLPLVRQTSGTTRLAGGQLACLQGIELEGGIVEGAGSCLADLTNSGGTVAPGGAGVGTLNLGQEPVSGRGGTFAQSGAGRLLVQLAGSDRFDRITAHANANLGGVLEVQLAEGFAPALGEEFTILTCGGVLNGAFGEKRLPSLAGGLEFEVVYGSNAVKLRARAR
jgi:hypothetical protein